jgi:hypothetical protein
MKLALRYISILFVLTLVGQSGFGQFFEGSEQMKFDSTYIKVYRDELTSRIFLKRKQNGISISDKLVQRGLGYKTNDNLLIGLGYTYSFLNINLAVKMPFVNSDDDIYGKSKYLDLSIQTYFRSFIFGTYLQWSNGYYLSNPENFQSGSVNEIPMQIRGDMRTNLIGLSIEYLFNSSRYSYKAAFLQNEFQKKSAGSPIAGVEAYWVLCMADSALSPYANRGYVFVSEDPYNQVDLFNFGINGGYAYTFVWNEKLYVSLAATLGLAGAYHTVHNTWDANTCCDGFSVGMTSNLKFSLGYNSNKYYVGVSFVRNSVSQFLGNNGDWMTYWNGDIRFNVVKRFNLKRTIKILRPDLWIL